MISGLSGRRRPAAPRRHRRPGRHCRFAEADLCTVEFLLDEAVAVKIIGGLEGEEGGHTHHHGAENFIADVMR
jgi:hypothetical protein